MTTCRVCSQPTKVLFSRRILHTHDATYSLCSECGFFQADDPHWLEQAYVNPLNIQDTGLIKRPLSMRIPAIQLIERFLEPKGKHLDYGGGTGVFARMMRDVGYDFYHYDKFTTNELARGFDYKDLPEAERNFELTTAFEVLEHTIEPYQFLAERMERTRMMLFSTDLQPSVAHLAEWSYIGPFHGQHISFLSEKTLHYIAAKIGVSYQRVGKYLHLFTRNPTQQRMWFDPAPWTAWRSFHVARKLWRALFKRDAYWLNRRLSLTEFDNQMFVDRSLGK